MTKRVFCQGKSKRAGDGESPVRVTAGENHFQVAILKASEAAGIKETGKGFRVRRKRYGAGRKRRSPSVNGDAYDDM